MRSAEDVHVTNNLSQSSCAEGIKVVWVDGGNRKANDPMVHIEPFLLSNWSKLSTRLKSVIRQYAEYIKEAVHNPFDETAVSEENAKLRKDLKEVHSYLWNVKQYQRHPTNQFKNLQEDTISGSCYCKALDDGEHRMQPICGNCSFKHALGLTEKYK